MTRLPIDLVFPRQLRRPFPAEFSFDDFLISMVLTSMPFARAKKCLRTETAMAN